MVPQVKTLQAAPGAGHGQLPSPGVGSWGWGPSGNSILPVSSPMLGRGCLQDGPQQVLTLAAPAALRGALRGHDAGRRGSRAARAHCPDASPLAPCPGFLQVPIPAPDKGTGLCLQRPGGLLPPAGLLGESCLSLQGSGRAGPPLPPLPYSCVYSRHRCPLAPFRTHQKNQKTRPLPPRQVSRDA